MYFRNENQMMRLKIILIFRVEKTKNKTKQNKLKQWSMNI